MQQNQQKDENATSVFEVVNHELNFVFNSLKGKSEIINSILNLVSWQNLIPVRNFSHFGAV